MVIAAPDAANSVAAPSTFTPTVSGTLRLRYESLNEGRFYAYSYVDLSTHALSVTFDDGSGPTALSDLLDGRFEFRRRVVGSFGFRGYYWDTYWSRTRPSWVTTYSKRTEGIDEYDAEPTFDLGEVEAGVPFTLGIDYVEPDDGTHPLTLSQTAATDTSFVLYGRYYAGGSPIGTPTRQVTVTLEVVPLGGRVVLVPRGCGEVAGAAKSSACPSPTPVAQDTVFVRGSLEVIVEAESEPDSLVTLTADTPHGRLVQIAEGDTTDVAGPIPFGDLADSKLLFLADGTWPDSTATVQIKGTLSGDSLDVATIVIPTPELRLLRQNDVPLDSTEIPFSPNRSIIALCDCIMVSKVRPDQLSPLNLGFESTYKGTPYDDYDPDTVRPELTGIADSVSVGFAIEVFRAGSRVPIPVDGKEIASGVASVNYVDTYRAIGETQRDSSVSYRGTRHVRFVSNSRPLSAPFGAGLYDDEWPNTIRVELGDVVRTRVVIGSDTLGKPLEVRVGRPPDETDGIQKLYYDERTADVVWYTADTLTTAPRPVTPETATARMNEDWAQAAVRFEVANQTTYSDAILQNVIGVELRSAVRAAGQVTAADTLEAQFVRTRSAGPDTVAVELTVAAGQSLLDVANKWAAQIATALGFPPTDARVVSGESYRESEGLVRSAGRSEQLLIVLRGPNPMYLASGVTGRQTVISQELLELRRLRVHHLGALAALIDDGVPQTIDVIPVRNGSMFTGTPPASGPGPDVSTVQNSRLLGKGLSDRPIPDPAVDLASRNVIFAVQSAVDERDDNPFVLGHEMGHVLDILHTDQDPQFPPGSSSLAVPVLPADTNLMKTPLDGVESLDGQKRLRPHQAQLVRQRDSSALSPVRILR